MSKEMIILQLPEKMRQEDHGFKFSTMMDSEIRFLKGKERPCQAPKYRRKRCP